MYSRVVQTCYVVYGFVVLSCYGCASSRLDICSGSEILFLGSRDAPFHFPASSLFAATIPAMNTLSCSPAHSGDPSADHPPPTPQPTSFQNTGYIPFQNTSPLNVGGFERLVQGIDTGVGMRSQEPMSAYANPAGVCPCLLRSLSILTAKSIWSPFPNTLLQHPRTTPICLLV